MLIKEMDVIVCSNDQNPANFIVELEETLDLSKLYQVAIKSISIATPSNVGNGKQLGFIYSNMVPHTNVNLKQRRYMALFPFDSNKGYNHQEFINPTYRTICKEATLEMEFEILNLQNERLQFSSGSITNFPTVIALHFREI